MLQTKKCEKHGCTDGGAIRFFKRRAQPRKGAELPRTSVHRLRAALDVVLVRQIGDGLSVFGVSVIGKWLAGRRFIGHVVMIEARAVERKVLLGPHSLNGPMSRRAQRGGGGGHVASIASHGRVSPM